MILCFSHLDPSGERGRCMPDQRLVAAETPLYDPVTLTDKPQDVFVDWPGNVLGDA